VKSITVSQLRSEMKSDSSLIVLDVRTPPELSGPLGKIDGVINIPLQTLDKRMDELEKYKDKKIAVICRTGHRSKIASGMLAKNGYNVENVQGGMTEYRKTE
jgi:rhodanese-related sulfurtransferase